MSLKSWEKQLGGAIRHHRLRKGLTQEKASEIYGCSLRWWQTLEQGRNVSVKVLLKIGGMLGVDPASLISGLGRPHPDRH